MSERLLSLLRSPERADPWSWLRPLWRRPALHTARLTMRPFTESDFEYLSAIRSDAEVTQFLAAGMQEPANVARRLSGYRRHRQQYGYALSAVLFKDSGEMIGSAGLQHLEHTGEIELSYAFARRAWGHGYATEAAAAWLRFGFDRLRLERIVAVAMPENARSRRVMDKLGMRYEKDAFHYGAHVVYYSIARNDFLAAERAMIGQ